MTTQEVILQRIKKLINHSESAKSLGNLQEAEAFMLKAIALSTEYNISLDAAREAEEKSGNEFASYGYSERIPFADKHQGDNWKRQLLAMIARYNFTGSISYPYLKEMEVYGKMENVEVTVWLYHFLSTGLYNLAEKTYQQRLAEKKRINLELARRFSKVEAYSFKRDFLLGAIQGIGLQLQKMRASQSQEANAVILRSNNQLEKFVSQARPNLRTVKMKTVRVGEGFQLGVEAGKNYNITKPLGTSAAPKGQIK